jgi:hypothetical protein
MEELTKKEISRQDLVDNKIFELINDLNPTDQSIEWNIEMIGEIRDLISNWIVDNLNLCKEKEFYPFIEES